MKFLINGLIILVFCCCSAEQKESVKVSDSIPQQSLDTLQAYVSKWLIADFDSTEPKIIAVNTDMIEVQVHSICNYVIPDYISLNSRNIASKVKVFMQESNIDSVRVKIRIDEKEMEKEYSLEELNEPLSGINEYVADRLSALSCEKYKAYYMVIFDNAEYLKIEDERFDLNRIKSKDDFFSLFEFFRNYMIGVKFNIDNPEIKIIESINEAWREAPSAKDNGFLMMHEDLKEAAIESEWEFELDMINGQKEVSG